MAAKVRCPGCGAKNALDARRCRVCIVLMNPDAPPGDEFRDESGAGAPSTDFDASELQRQLDRQPGPANGRGIFTGPSGLAARIAANGKFPPLPHAPLPPKHLAPPIDVSPSIDLDPPIDLDPAPQLPPLPSRRARTDDGPHLTLAEGRPDSVSEPDPAYATSAGGSLSAAAATDGYEPFDPDALFRD